MTAIETYQPEMLRTLIGDQGVTPAGFAQEADPLGRNNADEIIAAFDEALHLSTPTCEGWLPDAGTLPDRAYLIYRGVKFDWSEFGLSSTPSDGMTLQLFHMPGGWRLIYITPFEFEWDLELLEPLEPCPV